MTEITLRTDPPYSPEYTREVGRALAEAVRVLNHATHPANVGGLGRPSDTYNLLGSLYTATQRLPQLFEQIAEYLRLQTESGRIGDTMGRDPVNQALITGLHLTDAASSAQALTERLQAAQHAMAGLFSEWEGGDDPDPDYAAEAELRGGRDSADA